MMNLEELAGKRLTKPGIGSHAAASAREQAQRSDEPLLE
jgi:cystathionine beta-lyase family protein involved in aluminum resistance